MLNSKREKDGYMTEVFRFFSAEQAEKITAAARQDLMDMLINLKRKYPRDGEDHGTVDETLHESLSDDSLDLLNS